MNFRLLTVNSFKRFPFSSIFITHQHACACTARYCFANSVRLSVQCRYCVKKSGHTVTVFHSFWHSDNGIVL